MKTTAPIKTRRFRDTGRLQASSKRQPPAKPAPIDVFIVLAVTGEVLRVTNDPVDAERYRDVFQRECSHVGTVKIVKRTVTL